MARSKISRRRGIAYVEVLVIVGVVLVLGLVALKAIGDASSAQAEKEAACITSFGCKAGAPSGTGAIASAVSTSGSGGTPPPSEGKGFWGGALDVAKGFVVDGVWGTVKGVASAVVHPVDTVEGIGYAVAHPITTVTAIKDGIVTAYHDNPQRLVGAGIFQALTLPFAATKGAKVAEIATEAEDVAKVAKAAETAAAAAKSAKEAEDAAKASEAASLAKTDCVGGVCTGGSCFGPGTPVATPDGERPIETIQPGDLVMARDPETGITEPRRVEQLFVTHHREVLDLGLERDDGTIEHLVVTPEHPFWHEGEGFVPIASLSPGDLVRSAEGHLRIRSMAQLPSRITVYNFEVEFAHTYFVGSSAAWVHNSCGFKLGDEVLVPRSDGSISRGKIIAEGADGKVLVEVPTANGQVGTKLVSRDSLAAKAPEAAPPVKFGDPYVSLADGYHPDRIFLDYFPPGKTMASEGWKLHVSADPAQSYEVANRVLPELREMGVFHKVTADPAAYARMTGGQSGKFITIYPSSPEEAAAIARSIDGKLGDLKGTAPVIAGERPLGSSGSVYTRYGGFDKDTVTDPRTGREVLDVRGQASPPWITDPFKP